MLCPQHPLYNLRHSLSTWLVNKGKVDPKTVKTEALPLREYDTGAQCRRPPMILDEGGRTDSVSERNCFTIEALGQEWLSRNAIAGSRATVYGEFELLARC
jgi:hypothetical protein